MSKFKIIVSSKLTSHYNESTGKVIIKRSYTMKIQKSSKTKIKRKDYINAFLFIKALDLKLSYGKRNIQSLPYRRHLSDSQFPLGGFLKKYIDTLHNESYITDTLSIYKTIPLEIPLEENPIVTDINNIIVNPLKEPAPKQELNTYGPVCDISNITCYSSGILLR